MFLFQIGAIKSKDSVQAYVKVGFLFQIGAIKSRLIITEIHRRNKFLFQIGAIKRWVCSIL